MAKPANALDMPSPDPDFGNLLRVLRQECPTRPTLFEFFLNGPLYARLAGDDFRDSSAPEDWLGRLMLHGFMRAGYDYATVNIPGFGFPRKPQDHEQTISLNEGTVISTRADFDAYAWPTREAGDFAVLDRLAPELPAGAMFVVCGPGGVLENVIALVGYETLCYMILDHEQLAYDVFEAVGSRLTRFYEIAAAHPTVGACISNDDWGFKTQTMLSPEDMRRFVFPWHEGISAAIHAAGKPAILHSCGYFEGVIDDIVSDMKYDGRHSYEDSILSVEDSYERYHDRIAILGGIDVDFICRHTPDQVYERSKRMLERSAGRGAYGLGTGNSVPEYVPDEAYLAMIRAALDAR